MNVMVECVFLRSKQFKNIIMLQIDIRDIPEQVQEKPLGCGGTILGLAIVGFLAYVYVTGGLESSDSEKTKTEQESMQTVKTQSTYTADNSYSTSKPNTSSSNSKSNSYSESASASHNTSATSATSSAEYDESYQTYLALSTLLESDGKSLKLCEAQNETNGKEANVIGKMKQLRGTKYYNNALKDLVRCCPKYAKEYSKSGKYFASEAEFYQSYINPDYSSILKTKKKENR